MDATTFEQAVTAYRNDPTYLVNNMLLLRALTPEQLAQQFGAGRHHLARLYGALRHHARMGRAQGGEAQPQAGAGTTAR